MSEIVLVDRKDHPCNPVRVYKSDMLKDDVIHGEAPKKEVKKEKKSK